VNRQAVKKLVPFAYGFRPFFLVAGLFAALSVTAWLWVYGAGAFPDPRMPPQFWHGHEMLFGFVAAAVAGFLLTAVPSWTGSRGFSGRPLILLTALWLAGRIAFSLGDALPFALLAALELAFLPGVMLLVAPTLFRSSNRNTRLLVVLFAFWAMDALFLYGIAAGNVAVSAAALRGALGLVLVLITVIGGRIVPAFTRNAIAQSGQDAVIRSHSLAEKLVVPVMIGYAIAGMVAPTAMATAGIAAVAAALQAWRLSGWQGLRTGSQPIVSILHVAYLWLPVGLALKAAFLLGGFAWAAYWQHALGAGAAGTMILAVMTRAALGHTGRPLRAHPATVAAYWLLTAAVAMRVFGPALLPGHYTAVVMTAGTLWFTAFLLYVAIYAPVLLLPRADGKPG
jgi:uncharacterized protein involved in response to NO